jgi:hypothetical protein
MEAGETLCHVVLEYAGPAGSKGAQAQK